MRRTRSRCAIAGRSPFCASADALLQRIVSSKEHVYLNRALQEAQLQLHEQVFVHAANRDSPQWNEKQFRYSCTPRVAKSLVAYRRLTAISRQCAC